MLHSGRNGVFAKVFSQIYDSSIVEQPEVRFTFMDFLVLADKNGVVDMTHEAIARRTNRPIELIRETVRELENPDLKSRTPDFNGARIKRLDEHRDWGWMIINYNRFREIASEEQRREKTLERVRKHRGSSVLQDCNATVTPCNASNAMQKHKQMHKQKQSEGEWLLELQNDEAYRELDVKNEYAKMVRWCKEKGKQATRGRFINWLNRTDRPLGNIVNTTLSTPDNRPDDVLGDLVKNCKPYE